MIYESMHWTYISLQVVLVSLFPHVVTWRRRSIRLAARRVSTVETRDTGGWKERSDIREEQQKQQTKKANTFGGHWEETTGFAQFIILLSPVFHIGGGIVLKLIPSRTLQISKKRGFPPWTLVSTAWFELAMHCGCEYLHVHPMVKFVLYKYFFKPARQWKMWLEYILHSHS